jgi:putative membrane protein
MKKIGRSFMMLSGTAMLAGGLALAQMPAGGAPQQQQQQQTPNPGAAGPGAQTPSAMGQEQQQAGMQGSPGADKMFVKDALEGGMMEVQAGQLAVQKASRDDVKQFGQKMVDDHTKLGDNMKQVAQQMGVKVPEGPSKKQQAMLTKLQGLSGSQFDQAYIKMMVKDHKKDLSDFQMEAQNTTSPEVKSAATQGAGVIQQHLQMIEQISKSGANGLAKGE